MRGVRGCVRRGVIEQLQRRAAACGQRRGGVRWWRAGSQRCRSAAEHGSQHTSTTRASRKGGGQQPWWLSRSPHRRPLRREYQGCWAPHFSMASCIIIIDGLVVSPGSGS
ncbi:hypothetical protein PVAP13_3KG491700 [Panicum virgatum]|uniref:Uncharacterized protein n=1 Tax=Panicum virgatum TaxID=38727 RepID=A0A8T0V9B6_PANVG|nr:hypothetical protein PVAP13_3KG491700 [Panicum virgatum]